MVSRRTRRTRSSNHCSRAENENPAIIDAELAKGKFSYVYRGCKVKEIPVKHCVPLFRSRTLCQSAIHSLRKAIDVDESGNIGYSYAGGLKIVVRIPDEELSLVERYHVENGLSASEAKDFSFRQGIQWYGIVDGLHMHGSLSELEVLRPEPFRDFKWTVTVIEWQAISVLKAFSRARNLLQSKNTIEMTLYDTIFGLHEIALEKANLAGESLESFISQRGVITKIADEFCGGSRYSRETTRTLTGAALKIKPEALRVLGRIMTEENTSLAKKILEKHSSTPVREEDVFDARAFKHLISTNTIRGAREFLNCDGRDQANALWRLRHSYEDNGFKCFQAARLNKEVVRSERARHQVQLMKTMMCRDKWPEELGDIDSKLLTSSVFDSELDENEEIPDRILPSLITEYKTRMPLEAGLRWRLYCQDQARRSSTASTNQNNTQDPSTAEGGAEHGESGVVDGGERSDAPVENVEETDARSEQLCPLQQLNLQCLNMTLERYVRQRKADDDKFHMVTGDPSQLQLNGTCRVVIDETQADRYVSILKLLVHEHGWVFLYTSPVDYAMWSKAFRANGFEPLAYPWIMVRDTNTIQMNTSVIPQSITEMLIGARKTGNGRVEHQPDLTSRYKRAVSSRKRKFAIMDNCSEPRLKLKKPNTREPLRSNQRSAEPIAEFLDTFCPAQSYVLDAFAGTMETAKACYMTGRKCVALESDNLCYEVALKNLKESAAQYLEQGALLESGSPSELSQGCDERDQRSIGDDNSEFQVRQDAEIAITDDSNQCDGDCMADDSEKISGSDYSLTTDGSDTQ